MTGWFLGPILFKILCSWGCWLIPSFMTDTVALFVSTLLCQSSIMTTILDALQVSRVFAIFACPLLRLRSISPASGHVVVILGRFNVPYPVRCEKGIYSTESPHVLELDSFGIRRIAVVETQDCSAHEGATAANANSTNPFTSHFIGAS